MDTDGKACSKKESKNAFGLNIFPFCYKSEDAICCCFAVFIGEDFCGLPTSELCPEDPGDEDGGDAEAISELRGLCRTGPNT